MDAEKSALVKARARVARRELAKRSKLPAALAALEASLFPVQRAFVLDESRYIVNDSGRRSGKTRGAAVRALRAASKYPGAWVPIVERTTTCQAAQLMWRDLQDVNEQFGLGAEFHHTLMTATYPNRSRIQVIGGETMEALDKARGEHPPEVIVDEAGTFRPHVLEYGITQVLGPALMDYRGALVLCGTPAMRRVGPFYAASTNPAVWKHHKWTFRDNPHLPLDMKDASPAERAAAREAWFTELKAANGWTDESPFVQREYLGVWSEDASGLVYRIAPMNHEGVIAPPPDGLRYGLGVDIGHEDPSAFVVVAWYPRRSDLWVIESYERSGMIPSSIAAKVEQYRTKYRLDFIVADTGGAGKLPAEEMIQRYGIPVVAARKRGKESHVMFANGDLASNLIHILPDANQDLIADLYALRRAEGNGWGEDSRDDNHLPDAFLYAVTHQRGNLQGLGDRPPPERGTPEWLQAREERWLANALEQARLGQLGTKSGDVLDVACEGLPDW